MDLISIVVPVYNVERYIRKCVRSIIGQTYSFLEIILVDDGSTDGSGRICDEFAEVDKRIKAVHKNNEGLGLARNAGINMANGVYVCFIDSDDYIAEDYIDKIYSDLKKNEADVCYCGHTKDIDGQYEIRTNPFGGQKFIGNNIREEVIPRMCGCKYGNDSMEMSSCMAIYSMRIIKDNALKFPSERKFISEDLLFNILYLSHCTVICMSDCNGYYYVTVNSSLTRKYNPDRLNQQIIMTEEVTRLTKELGIYDKCKERIYNNFLTWMRVIINTEQNRYSEIGMKQSLRQIMSVCNNLYVNNIAQEYNNVGVKTTSRIINELIKRKKCVLLWGVMFLKNRMGV